MYQTVGANIQLLFIAAVTHIILAPIAHTTAVLTTDDSSHTTASTELEITTNEDMSNSTDYTTRAAPMGMYEAESYAYNISYTNDWDDNTTISHVVINNTNSFQNSSSNYSSPVLCDRDQDNVCKGRFCDLSTATCPLPDPPARGLFVIDGGVKVDGCVGAGEMVFLVCEEGYEVVEGSLMLATEFVCLTSGRLDVWIADLCVPVECELPSDWLVFTELETETPKVAMLFPPDTQLRIMCWLEGIQINWSYLLHCKRNGVWENAESISRSDCQKPKPEPDILYNALEDEEIAAFTSRCSPPSNQIQVLSLTSANRVPKYHTPAVRDIWGHSNDYHIQTSWVPKGDTLRDSMLAYSRKMSDMRRLRGIHVSKSYQNAETSPSLLVSTSRSSFELLSMSEETGRRIYATNNRLVRSLGSIKLQPLLGSKISNTKSDSTALRVYNMNKEKSKSEKAVTESSGRQLDEENVRPVRHITVTIDAPPINDKIHDEELEENNSELEELNAEPDTDTQLKKQITPLGSGKKRPKKAKRMKIEPPALDSISEDSSATQTNTRSLTERSDSPLRGPKNLEDSYHSLLEDISQSHEAMLLQKRQTVALLKQTNYGIQTHKQKQQMALASYAKKKLRKLPPIPDTKTAFRYSHHRQPGDMSHLTQLLAK